MSGGGNLNSVFYADSYHPIQAGSIDGTDIAPHDNAVYRAHLCSAAGLYDPFGDPKVIGDPYCTLFVGRLSHLTTEDTLLKVMSKHGHVKSVRLVRHIVTGASRGYAFVEFESEKEMRRAYKDAHHSFIDDSEIIVDYNRQQLMPGWIPRRLGGGLGGKKESGQLRFGGRERPFRAPIRPIPHDELKRLGIPPPPEGRYMSRFQVPSPPRRKRTFLEERDRREITSLDREDLHRSSKDSAHHRRTEDGEERSYSNKRSSIDDRSFEEDHRRRYNSKDKEERYSRYDTRDDDRTHRSFRDEESPYDDKSFEEDHRRRYSSIDKEERYSRYDTRGDDQTHRSFRDEEDHSRRRKSVDSRKDHDHHKGRKRSSYEKRENKSIDVDGPPRSSHDREEHSSHKHRHGHRSKRHRHEEDRGS